MSDEELEPITASLLGSQELNLILGSDQPFELPGDGRSQPGPCSRPPLGSLHPLGFYPPPGGFRFWYFTLPPDTAGGAPIDVDIESAKTELNSKLPGLADVLEPDNPRMHTTDTVDVDLVVSGEVWLELDDGVEVHLRAGDCVVLSGNRHAWRNRSTETSVMAVAILGARRVS